MSLAEQKAVVAHTAEAFTDVEPDANMVTEAAKAVLKDSEARGGGVQMLGVDKIYPGSNVKALNDFNLEIKPGEMVVLLGGSGCGKSTALRSLAGLEDIQAGRILVGGQDVTGVPVNKRDMAMVFQAYSLFPHMTALQNVEFGLEIRGVTRAERRHLAMEKLDLVGLADQAGKYTQQMSGGQQQRVALARALAVNPRVLLLDEPLSALDAKVRVQLRDEIRRIQLEAGTTTVFVTHDQEEALAVADRIGVMNHGRIEQIADPQTLYRRPETEYVATFIGLTNRLPGISNGAEAVVFGQRVPLLEGSRKEGAVVLVRPENMTIAMHEAGVAGSGSGAGEVGRVEMVHFLGGAGPCGRAHHGSGIPRTRWRGWCGIARDRAGAGQRAAVRSDRRLRSDGRSATHCRARRVKMTGLASMLRLLY